MDNVAPPLRSIIEAGQGEQEVQVNTLLRTLGRETEVVYDSFVYEEAEADEEGEDGKTGETPLELDYKMVMMKSPTNMEDLCQVLGLITYVGRLPPGLSTKLHPITSLLKGPLAAHSRRPVCVARRDYLIVTDYYSRDIEIARLASTSSRDVISWLKDMSVRNEPSFTCGLESAYNHGSSNRGEPLPTLHPGQDVRIKIGWDGKPRLESSPSAKYAKYYLVETENGTVLAESKTSAVHSTAS
ncbi:hypothetical protein GOODEAATRI_017759 [Goodea atripinnis]|uniref:Uncharacterized protein n=1 Tax=Goodea atripinnis TaxID=208336 RepID=A0ABV0PPJ7_9TELE